MEKMLTSHQLGKRLEKMPLFEKKGEGGEEEEKRIMN